MVNENGLRRTEEAPLVLPGTIQPKDDTDPPVLPKTAISQRSVDFINRKNITITRSPLETIFSSQECDRNMCLGRQLANKDFPSDHTVEGLTVSVLDAGIAAIECLCLSVANKMQIAHRGRHASTYSEFSCEGTFDY